jgi:hypothetical protein
MVDAEFRMPEGRWEVVLFAASNHQRWHPANSTANFMLRFAGCLFDAG